MDFFVSNEDIIFFFPELIKYGALQALMLISKSAFFVSFMCSVTLKVLFLTPKDLPL